MPQLELVGEISLGRPEVGGRLLETNAPAQDKVWTMILREATAKRTIAPSKGDRHSREGGNAPSK